MKRNILHSPHIDELKKRKRKIFKIKIIFSVFCLLIVFIGLIFLSRWENLNINNIHISGNKVIENQIIEAIVKENLSGHYLRFFPKTNFMIYPQNKIKNELENRFKIFKDISINDKDIKTLEINVVEREEKYTWCGISMPTLEDNKQKCYFMDENGYIFEEAPYFSGNVYFKFFGNDNLNVENPTGFYFMKDKFMNLVEFKDMLKKLNFNSTAFFIDKNMKEGSFFISKETIIGSKIIFKIDSDYEKLVENLQAAISTEPLKSDLKKKLSSLLYLDLRFNNKVYFKFSDGSGYSPSEKL